MGASHQDPHSLRQLKAPPPDLRLWYIWITLVYSTHLLIYTFSLFKYWYKPSPLYKIQVKYQTKPQLLIFDFTLSLPHKKLLFWKFFMTSLNLICGFLPLPQSTSLAEPMQSFQIFLMQKCLVCEWIYQMFTNAIGRFFSCRGIDLQWKAILWQNFYRFEKQNKTH